MSFSPLFLWPFYANVTEVYYMVAWESFRVFRLQLVTVLKLASLTFSTVDAVFRCIFKYGPQTWYREIRVAKLEMYIFIMNTSWSPKKKRKKIDIFLRIRAISVEAQKRYSLFMKAAWQAECKDILLTHYLLLHKESLTVYFYCTLYYSVV